MPEAAPPLPEDHFAEDVAPAASRAGAKWVQKDATILVAHPGAELYGSDRMMLESVEAFVGRGWRVVVVLPNDGPLVGEVESRGAAVRICITPVLRRAYLSPIGMFRLGMLALRALPAGVRLLRDIRPDAVYVSTMTAPLWLVLARLLRVPVVCHVHEAESTAPVLVRKALAAPQLLSQRLIVNSRYSAGALVDAWRRLEPRSAVIYNGVAGPPEPMLPRATLTPPIRLLCVGRLSVRKGVHDVVDALAILDARGLAAQLDILGDTFEGYEWVADDLRRRATAAGVGDRVHLHGFDPLIWRHLDHADVVVVPCHVDESFGNVAIEGALAARPLVVSRTSGLIEAVDGLGAALTVAPGQPAALADAVCAIGERWDEFRARAITDAPRTAERFSEDRYRRAVADAVACLL